MGFWFSKTFSFLHLRSANGGRAMKKQNDCNDCGKCLSCAWREIESIKKSRRRAGWIAVATGAAMVLARWLFQAALPQLLDGARRAIEWLFRSPL